MIAPLIHIFYNLEEEKLLIEAYLETEDRLSELVIVEKAIEDRVQLPNSLIVAEGRIIIRPEWLDTRPGVVFAPNISFNKKIFLGVVFGLLGNQEKSLLYLSTYPKISNSFRLLIHLQGEKFSENLLEALLDDTAFNGVYDGYTFNHNIAIGLNYGRFQQEIHPEAIESHYIDALEVVYEPVYKAYTTYFYALFLMDMGKAYEASVMLSSFPMEELPEYAIHALRKVNAHCFVSTLTLPFDQERLPEMKQYLWETLSFYEKNNHKIHAAQLYLDAAHVANLSASYSEALGYITKAIQFFEEEDQYELAGQAIIEKGRLLYTWAKSGNPQFFRKSLEAYQSALVLFNKDVAPDVFAEIHHQLGVIYSELPDENSKKSIWASVSVTSFHEALEFYNKDQYPYEYGMICNNFGNAYTLYPAAVNSDNFQTALGYYTQALMVRPADQFPNERVMTLLNYLDTAWKAGNEGKSFNQGRYFDMKSKAEEILNLTDNEAIKTEALSHLDELEKLRNEFNSSKPTA